MTSAHSPALPTSGTVTVSVIIPVRNGGATLDACLRSIKRSYFPVAETIVVDDHSTDNTAAIAGRHRCTFVPVREGSGANNARNIGAQRATGDILLFIDSDIVIRRETILEVVETLDDPTVDAVVGLYTAKHRHENFISQYKNLWIRYSYIKSPPAIDWLFGAISGIKKDAFARLGGFNAELQARHGHDDIELGKRASRAKVNIVLNMDIEVEHLKHYSLWSFIKNEFNRSSGFARLALHLGEVKGSLARGFVNVYPSFVISTGLSALLVLAAVGYGSGHLPLWLCATLGALYLLFNIRFLNYLEQVRGLFAMVVMVPILFVDHLVCFVGSLAGIFMGRR